MHKLASSLPYLRVAVIITLLLAGGRMAWPVAAAPAGTAAPTLAGGSVIINEIDSQTPGTDAAEFIELYDGGVGNTDLTGLVVVLFNGGATNDVSYNAFDLDGHSTDANGYFLIGNAAVPGVGITMTNNSFQNGQDGVGLFLANASDFPNGTPVTNTNLIDAIVYQDVSPGTPDPALVAVLLNAGQAMVFEGTNTATAEAQSLQRCANGAGGARNTANYRAYAPTPGAASYCPGNLAVTKTGPAQSLPNATLRYTLGVTYQGATTATAVLLTDTLPLSTTYVADSSGFTPTLAAPNTYVWNFGDVAPGFALTFNLTTTLSAGVPGAVITNTATISGGVVGNNPADDAASWGTQVSTTPVIPQVLINEVDAQTLSTDNAEFIELYDGGVGQVSLNGLIVVLFNGVTDESYRTIDLTGYATDANGYLVIGSAGVTGVDIVLPNSALQNGTDAVALYAASASAFPNGTLITDTALLDAVVYDDTSAGRPDAYMQSVLLNPGELLVWEGLNTAAAELQSIGRCPNGYGGARNTRHYTQFNPTPSADNLCAAQLVVEKTAPKLVAPGANFQYTLTVGNFLGYALNNVVLTDVLPANVQYVSGGVFNAGQVTWLTSTLPQRGVWVVTMTVTAPMPFTASVVNALYAVTATNYLTPTGGVPVVTIIGVPPLQIFHLQGFSHRSSFEGYAIRDVAGIVTVVGADGFYMQTATQDSDRVDDTSDGIWVYTAIPPGRAVGDAVLVDGLVTEYYPGGYDTGNLSITELEAWDVSLVSSGNPLPAPVVIGNDERVPPTSVIDDDSTGNVETTGTFDPVNDGIDFYESLEGMRVQVNNATVVGPTNAYGEVVVVGDGGTLATNRTPRGGVALSATDFNPERIILDDALTPNTPLVSVGITFTAPLVGVVSYDFGNFKLLQTQAWPMTSGTLVSETTSLAGSAELSVVTMNLENLDPNPFDGDDDGPRFVGLAHEIVDRLHSPDIIGVQEVQDNTGATNDGVVDANTTFSTLITWITTIGGPTYEYRQINPLNDTDGGEPGGNIRVGFLFRTDRGLTFVDRPGATSTTAVTATLGLNGVELNYSPGRLDPTNSAFNFSRKPLAGEFMFRGHKLFVVVAHLNSKGGDTPVFGRVQPFARPSEVQRQAQAQIVQGFVAQVLALDPQANVIVLGDMNDFPYSPAIQTLAGSNLYNLITTLPANEQYTYVYEGNSQVLDHILVSGALNARLTHYDVVHMNAEFPAGVQLTDHDPSVAHFDMTRQLYLPFIRR